MNYTSTKITWLGYGILKVSESFYKYSYLKGAHGESQWPWTQTKGHPSSVPYDGN